MGRERKKVVFLLFEGPSDYNAFYIPISRLYEEIDEDIEVIYGYLEDGKQETGDITSKKGVRPENIEEVMTKIVFKPNLNREGLYPKDLVKVIQFVDMDGVYITNDMIELDSSCAKLRYDDKIYTNDIQSTVVRNINKSANLDYLTSLQNIKIVSKTIPYEVYYSSTNLEHVISDTMNFTGSKISNAKEFCQKVISTTKDFSAFFNLVKPPIENITYDSSWEFIKKDNNSLKRFSNIGILIDRLIDSIK